MKLVDRTFPLPYYKINKKYQIQSCSKEAEDLFGPQENLLDIFDEYSKPKVKNWVNPEVQKVSVEIHLKPINEEDGPLTADMYVSWENDLYAEVMLMMKDSRLTKVTKTMNQLRARLNDTNFELLDEKEKLEEAIAQNNRLSAPFIDLTEDTALVPLFGDITSEKMYAIEEYLLQSSQRDGIDRILFDFTAVRHVERDGIQVFNNLMTSVFYMGPEVVLIGIRPEQAKQLSEMNMLADIKYMNSLQQAIMKYCAK
ncbi:STAS domain-containing protein [Halobacillus mangrovi]|uniref:STAS domain-containing protein n=1 Tax=Halobacillus mangrovi TaxID=402384 RepID=UPI003D97A43C